MPRCGDATEEEIMRTVSKPGKRTTSDGRKLGVLKEEFFPVVKNAWSLKKCAEACSSDEDCSSHYVYHITAGSRNKVIAGPLFMEPGETGFEQAAKLVKEKKNFQNVIRQFRPESFKEMLFLADAYYACVFDWLLNFDYYRSIKADESAFLETGTYIRKRIAEANRSERPTSARHAAMCEILAESNGLLCWGYQLELILGLFVSGRDEIVALRRGFNAKKPEALKRLGRMRVDSKTSLRSFIGARLLFSYGCVHSPDLKGGLELYNALR